MADETAAVETAETEVEPKETARDVTERAFEALETEVEPKESVESVDQTDGESEQTGKPRDESGRFTKAEKTAKTGETLSSPQAKVVGKPAPGSAAAPGAGPVASRALQYLKPSIREQWDTMPRDVKDEFMRLQGVITRAYEQVSKGGESAKTADAYQKAVAPYEATIRQSGLEPAAYIGNVMQTVHGLTYGPSHVKADILAGIVMQYAPDLLRPDQHDEQGNPISCPLDRALGAKMRGAPAPAGGQGQPQTFQDPRVDKLLTALQTQQQQRVEAQESEANNRLEEFAETHEFLDDVRDEFADILDLWAKRGKKDVTPEEMERAYNLVCRNNEDVAPVFQQREDAGAMKQKQDTARKQRAAAASIPSRAASHVPQDRNKLTNRQITEKAFDDLAGRV